jgi:hypothetical protein
MRYRAAALAMERLNTSEVLPSQLLSDSSGVNADSSCQTNSLAAYYSCEADRSTMEIGVPRLPPTHRSKDVSLRAGLCVSDSVLYIARDHTTYPARPFL